MRRAARVLPAYWVTLAVVVLVRAAAGAHGAGPGPGGADLRGRYRHRRVLAVVEHPDRAVLLHRAPARRLAARAGPPPRPGPAGAAPRRQRRPGDAGAGVRDRGPGRRGRAHRAVAAGALAELRRGHGARRAAAAPREPARPCRAPPRPGQCGVPRRSRSRRSCSRPRPIAGLAHPRAGRPACSCPRGSPCRPPWRAAAPAPLVLGRDDAYSAALASRPARNVGTVSYGLFLWHLPVFAGLYALTGARVFTGRHHPAARPRAPDQPVPGVAEPRRRRAPGHALGGTTVPHRRAPLPR